MRYSFFPLTTIRGSILLRVVWYISEIILVLWKNGFKIHEIKSTFRNRVRGESSVNLKLIIESLLGLFKLYLIKKSFKI